MFCESGCLGGETDRFFVRQTVWKVLSVGENSASSLICVSGCVSFFLRGGSSVFLSFYRFLIGAAVLRIRVGLFSVLESRYCRE